MIIWRQEHPRLEKEELITPKHGEEKGAASPPHSSASCFLSSSASPFWFWGRPSPHNIRLRQISLRPGRSKRRTHYIKAKRTHHGICRSASVQPHTHMHTIYIHTHTHARTRAHTYTHIPRQFTAARAFPLVCLPVDESCGPARREHGG